MTLALAILLSGRGSNMQAIHRAVLGGKLDAEIKLVLSDQAQAQGLDYARSHGLANACLEKAPDEKRDAFDQRLIQKIEESGAEWIALAGYMRILSPLFIRSFPSRIVNIHPSLLPAFPGLHAQRQALEAGVKESGCTVHFVDEGCDTGPILDQRRVPVLPGDTEDRLASRILEQEHQLYPACLQAIAENRVSLENGRVVWRGRP